MRYVPSLPPIPGVEETPKPKAVDAVRPVKRVTPRTRPPLIVQHFHTPLASAGEAEQPQAPPLERRSGEERRKVCRRTERGRTLGDTRSGKDRRRRGRRRGDVATSIDEEV
jgi:hypothetical protein